MMRKTLQILFFFSFLVLTITLLYSGTNYLLGTYLFNQSETVSLLKATLKSGRETDRFVFRPRGQTARPEEINRQGSNKAIGEILKNPLEDLEGAADAKMMSASSLERYISIENALEQTERISLKTGIDLKKLHTLVLEHQKKVIFSRERIVDVISVNKGLEMMLDPGNQRVPKAKDF